MTSFSASAETAHPPHHPPLSAARLRLWPEWLWCLGAAALWFGCTAGLRPLALPDEGRYVGVAWEMLRSGDWWVPTLDGLPFFHKPPLFYWITAGAMELLGPGVAASRAAAWLASVTVSTSLFVFLRQWVGRQQAWMTVVVLATIPLFYGAAQYANMDMLVAACVSAAILLVAQATLTREEARPYLGALAGAFVAAALGVLAKGLIGVALPVLVLLAWGATTRRLGRIVTLLMWGPGWLLFALIAAPWHLAMQSRFPDFAHYFFVVQHFQRYTSASFNNGQAWWFYLVALLVLALPWSPWLTAAFRRRPVLVPVHADVRALMLVWPGTVIAFFSLPSSKLVGYILPALPPLAFLLSDAASPYWSKSRAGIAGGPPNLRTRAHTGWLAATPALAAVVCLAATVAAHFYQPKSLRTLGETLHGSRHVGEPVIFVGGYYYDVNFYARLEAPVTVVDPWLPSDVADDSWRRELVDAEHFAPTASPRRLLGPSALGAALCGARSSWVVGPWPATMPGLRTQAPAQVSGATALWHVDSQTPSARLGWHCDELLARP